MPQLTCYAVLKFPLTSSITTSKLSLLWSLRALVKLNKFFTRAGFQSNFSVESSLHLKPVNVVFTVCQHAGLPSSPHSWSVFMLICSALVISFSSLYFWQSLVRTVFYKYLTGFTQEATRSREVGMSELMSLLTIHEALFRFFCLVMDWSCLALFS